MKTENSLINGNVIYLDQNDKHVNKCEEDKIFLQTKRNIKEVNVSLKLYFGINKIIRIYR